MAKKAKNKIAIIGRAKESEVLKKTLSLHRNLLVEGPVGVGKTFLIQELLSDLGRNFSRVDGDTRYTEQKLTGWFDPPMVLKKGYVPSCFIDGPLVEAMKKGDVLFINELNRMPEAVQNILLPAMDEKKISIPKIGEVHAKEGFCVVATQNPKEFTATHALSEALLDRFEMMTLDYQTQEEELEILQQEVPEVPKATALRAVSLVRATRTNASIKRGASVRAAIAICKLITTGMEFEEAVALALPSRIELISNEESVEDVIDDMLKQSVFTPHDQKKK